jgi:hypothetical protein
MSVSAKKFIRLIVIDEAHSVLQDGRDLRPEFHSAVVTLRKIYDNLPTPCIFLAMSATFRQDDQDEITHLWTRPLDKVIWRELSRRGIGFDVVISGCPTSSIVRSMSEDYCNPTAMKTIINTNSKTLAMGSLTTALEKMLEKCEESWRRMGHESFIPGRVISFTGDDGLQSKVFVMRAWASDMSDHDNIDQELPNLLIMPATKAADCGVSSNSCHRSYRVSVASSLYSIVQEMGRVD